MHCDITPCSRHKFHSRILEKNSFTSCTLQNVLIKKIARFEGFPRNWRKIIDTRNFLCFVLLSIFIPAISFVNRSRSVARFPLLSDLSTINYRGKRRNRKCFSLDAHTDRNCLMYSIQKTLTCWVHATDTGTRGLAAIEI